MKKIFLKRYASPSSSSLFRISAILNKDKKHLYCTLLTRVLRARYFSQLELNK